MRGKEKMTYFMTKNFIRSLLQDKRDCTNKC
jgi:hypothetical protein